MARLEAQHQPVEEAPPPARAFDEKAIHGRGQPDHLHDVAQIGGAACFHAVQPHMAFLAAIRPQRQSRTNFMLGAAARHRRRHRPQRGIGSHRPLADMLGQFRPAQAAARRQQGDRIQDVGLAGAVRSRQHHRRARQRQRAGRIGAKIAQPQLCDRQLRGRAYPIGLGSADARHVGGEFQLRP